MGESHTPLHAEHLAARAKMVPFAGYMMPIEYSGIIAEHRAVRSTMGIFDLSHMGELVLRGEEALSVTDSLVTNQVSNLDVWQARYSPMCREDGGIIDDLLIYRYPDRVMLVVNASNIEKDFAWVHEHLSGTVSLENESASTALIAVQGPNSVELVAGLTSADVARIPYYHFNYSEACGIPATISRTGYTGEDGVELYVDAKDASRLWTCLMDAGAPNGLVPVGLGARDTLRLEASLALYGNDITEDTQPLEAGLGWTVKFGREFVGSKALERIREEGSKRRLIAFEMQDRTIARQHTPVLIEENVAGEVTSGTFSPTFSRGIGMAYLPTGSSKIGTSVDMEIRGQSHPARIKKKPLYQRKAETPDQTSEESKL